MPETIVPVMFFLIVVGLPITAGIISRVLAHQERMEMLRHGIVPPPDPRAMRHAIKYGVKPGWTPGAGSVPPPGWTPHAGLRSGILRASAATARNSGCVHRFRVADRPLVHRSPRRPLRLRTVAARRTHPDVRGFRPDHQRGSQRRSVRIVRHAGRRQSLRARGARCGLSAAVRLGPDDAAAARIVRRLAPRPDARDRKTGWTAGSHLECHVRGRRKEPPAKPAALSIPGENKMKTLFTKIRAPSPTLPMCAF